MKKTICALLAGIVCLGLTATSLPVSAVTPSASHFMSRADKKLKAEADRIAATNTITYKEAPTPQTRVRHFSAVSGSTCGNYTGKWIYTTRTRACHHAFRTYNVYRNSYSLAGGSAAKIGSFTAGVRTTVDTNTKSGSVKVKIDVHIDAFTGNRYITRPDKVVFDPRPVSGWTRTKAGSSPTGHDSTNSSWTGTAAFNKKLKRKSAFLGRFFTNTIRFYNIRVDDRAGGKWNDPTVRCDTEIRKSIGCVFSQHHQRLHFLTESTSKPQAILIGKYHPAFQPLWNAQR